MGGHYGRAASFEALPLCSSSPRQLQYEEGPPRNLGTPAPSTPRPSLTPTKKIELDRTIMPDGTIVTTVTTVQSRPRVEGKLGKEKGAWLEAGAPGCRICVGQGRAREALSPAPAFQPHCPHHLYLSNPLLPSTPPFPWLFLSCFSPGSARPSFAGLLYFVLLRSLPRAPAAYVSLPLPLTF